ncbi:MFS transporter [Burkholderia cepacia]|uniref:MFS transporter n=1 Tax=Burkholderia cepacia TaxID=292 RepID=UPI0012952A58|nr:MFS transporter [Burkholderia cepacia]QFS37623.1 Major Facilitator Superfamily [Burkholderia cepacia]
MSNTDANHWRRNLIVCFFGSFSTVLAMTLMLPFLPLYVEQLGVSGHAAIVQWSGIAFGATFVTAGLSAPMWGHLGDRYGRKPMLIRASFGMAIMVALMGFASNIWQLIGLRLLVGLAGGYSSGATILVAEQSPKSQSGWALGVLASGVMAGNLIGPLAGGILPPMIGIRGTFWCAATVIFVAFLATVFLVHEVPSKSEVHTTTGHWGDIPDKNKVIAMLLTGLMLTIANMSIEPIITVYVQSLITDPRKVTFVSGLVMSAAAFGSVLSASQLGKVADRIGHAVVITGALGFAALLLIPQAFVTSGWQLIGLRFLMGVSLGGLLPCITAVIRHSVPDKYIGRALGYSISFQFAGQVVGPLVGGFVGGHGGIRYVFVVTSGLLLLGACYSWWALDVARSSTKIPSSRP